MNSEFVIKLVFLLTGIRKSDKLNEVSSSTPPPCEDNGILFVLISAVEVRKFCDKNCWL